MSPFPGIDPIPLPGPVWVFKALHLLTTALHFAAVELLLGSLLAAAFLNLLGSRSAGEAARLRLGAAGALARRLPIIMTYVINLGVPPLLFAQVLYGRAIYTSSVLIGAWWISVIFLLMLCYWLLYRFAARAEAGQSGWKGALLSWLVAAAIAKIYSVNMTLMLRPEVWGDLYSAGAYGLKLPTGDPTVMPRWLLMIVGGLLMAGMWMIRLAGRQAMTADLAAYLRRQGALLAVFTLPVLGAVAWWVMGAQPAAVRAGLWQSVLYQAGAGLWLGAAATAAVVAAASLAGKKPNFLAWLAMGAGVLMMSGWTLVRDGVRDLTLAAKGFAIQGPDLWGRAVATNWSVLILFLVSLAAGLAVMGWLISVVMRARTIEEGTKS